MVMCWYNILFIFILAQSQAGTTFAVKATQPFSDTSTDVFNVHDKYSKGRVVAFADLNSDKKTDIITLSTNDNALQVMYSGDDKDLITISQLLYINDTANLSSVVPADFDGDLATDFLFIYHTVAENIYRLQLCFGSRSTLHYGQCVNITQTSTGHPTILDYNADMLPDILLENPQGNLILLVSLGSSRNFSSSDISSHLWGGLAHPHQSSAFVDLNRDLAADIALTATKGVFIAINKEGLFNLNPPEAKSCIIGWPSRPPSAVLGMTSFLDYDSDSYMDIIVTTTSTDHTTLHVVNGKLLKDWLNSDCKDDSKPGFKELTVKLTDKSGTLWHISPADSWLRVGDADNDGYFDLLVTLKDTHSGNTRPFILLNSKCNDTCTAGKRSFVVMWDWLPAQHNITQAAFYDIYNNGMLDVVLNVQVEDHTEVRLLDNNVAKGSCFVSVKVGSGLCTEDKDDSCSKPYPNMVGATIQYNSTHPDGTLAFGTATQLTQSTNNALQIPYVQFGLGGTPNFVDSLTVGIPRNQDYSKWTETWKSIVPNSHLMVVPRPPGEPNKWVMHLYVTPSHLVLITGAVIIGLGALIAIIIVALQLKERYEDKKVKSQEAHRFHFNAM